MRDEADEAIREAMERNAKAVALRPAIGLRTARTTAKLRSQLECVIEEGPWRATAGMAKHAGGNDAGPSPGFYGRSALASCLTIGIGMWAARLQVPLDSVEVIVEADYDSRGELAVSDEVRPGYLQIRCIVSVASSAPEADVRRVIETAKKYSPFLDVFTATNDVRTELRMMPATAAKERSE